MSVTWNLTHRVVEQRHLHDLRQGSQSLQILPLRQVVVVQVQELQVHHASENLSRRQRLQLVVTEVNFLQSAESLQEGKVLH